MDYRYYRAHFERHFDGYGPGYVDAATFNQAVTLARIRDARGEVKRVETRWIVEDKITGELKCVVKETTYNPS